MRGRATNVDRDPKPTVTNTGKSHQPFISNRNRLDMHLVTAPVIRTDHQLERLLIRRAQSSLCSYLAEFLRSVQREVTSSIYRP